MDEFLFLPSVHSVNECILYIECTNHHLINFLAITQQPTQSSYMQQTQQRTNQQMQQTQLQQEPTAAEINIMLNSLGLGLPPTETLQLANWDLKKLAMYLVSRRWSFRIFYS